MDTVFSYTGQPNLDVPFKPDFNKMRLDYLIDYIVAVHHSYLKNMIPVINQSIQQINEQSHHSSRKNLSHLFSILYKDLKMHLIREEEILFPYIKRLAKAELEGLKVEKPFFGSVKLTISSLNKEHENNIEIFLKLRQITSDYTPPSDVCSSYKEAFKMLKDFDEDYITHSHLENSILFSRGADLEDKLLSFNNT
jgi:regulator of cell morphogenesis and NO signaling